MPHFIKILFAALFLTFSIAPDAKAIPVTIGGTVYNVEVAANTPFNTFATEIMNSPWWNDITLANQAAANYFTAVGGAGNVPVSAGGTDELVFAYDLSGGFVIGRSLAEFDGTVAPSFPTLPTDPVAAFYGYAYVAPAAMVPEINGATLAQTLFVLLALGVFLTTHRARHTL